VFRFHWISPLFCLPVLLLIRGPYPQKVPGKQIFRRLKHDALTADATRCIVPAMKALVLLVAIIFSQIIAAGAAESIYDIPLKDIDGKNTSLKPYQGKVLLIVNVASKCGFTPQYTALEAIYQKYKGHGLVVLGFPCNQFGQQEPGTDLEIKQFCTSKYDVTFPMFDKIEVNGANRHPLYVMLAGQESPFPGNIGWNFTKFLIGRDGKILNRFNSPVKPDSAEVTQAIEAALAAK
jgi:glutathione peroxidase